MTYSSMIEDLSGHLMDVRENLGRWVRRSVGFGLGACEDTHWQISRREGGRRERVAEALEWLD